MTFSQPVTWENRVEAESELAKSHYQYNRTIADAGYVSVYFDKNPKVKDRIGKVIHAEPICVSSGRHPLRRVPTFYEEDGTRKALWQNSESEVRECENCRTRTPLDIPWGDRAACRGTKPEDPQPWGEDYAMFMDLYCEECPVVRECLSFGIVENSGGMVYGGIYFSKDKAQRKRAIRERKRELQS